MTLDTVIAVKVHNEKVDNHGLPMFKVKTTWTNRRYFDVLEQVNVISRRELMSIVKWRSDDQRFAVSDTKPLTNSFLEKEPLELHGIPLRMKSFMEQYNGPKGKQ